MIDWPLYYFGKSGDDLRQGNAPPCAPNLQAFEFVL